MPQQQDQKDSRGACSFQPRCRSPADRVPRRQKDYTRFLLCEEEEKRYAASARRQSGCPSGEIGFLPTLCARARFRHWTSCWRLSVGWLSQGKTQAPMPPPSQGHVSDQTCSLRFHTPSLFMPRRPDRECIPRPVFGIRISYESTRWPESIKVIRDLLEIRKLRQAWVVTEGATTRGKHAREPGQDEFCTPSSRLVKKKGNRASVCFTSDGSRSETSVWESSTSLNPPTIARLSFLGETDLFFVAATVRRSSSILTLRSEPTPCWQRSPGRVLAPLSRSSDKSEARPTNARHVVASTTSHCTLPFPPSSESPRHHTRARLHAGISLLGSVQR